MSEINHILYETGVSEIFKLVVEDSTFAGTYEIEKPDGWDEIDSIVDIDDVYFNVQNVILGDSNKITFLQYVGNSGYDIVKKVYEEKGGDGRIIFKVFTVKNGVEVDLLGNSYELNLNKYNNSFELSMLKIEVEIKKRESQSKLLNREDTSVNLFSEKDLDDLDIEPLSADDFFYKEGSKRKTNFYYQSDSQLPRRDLLNSTFWLFSRGDDFQIGDNTNSLSGYKYMFGTHSGGLGFYQKYNGALLSTRSKMPKVQIEISNMNVFVKDKTFKLFAVISNGLNFVREIELKVGQPLFYAGMNGYQVYIVNEIFECGILNENENIQLIFRIDNGELGIFFNLNDSASIEVHSDLETPIRKSKIVKLNKAIDRVCKLYTNGNITLKSKLLNTGGYYFNTGISTGLFLRGIYTENILKTSLKNLLYEGVLPLLASGFDLQDDKLVVEDLNFFFKDVESYDLSDKDYLQENYSIKNDLDITYNQIMFGGKKYSSNKNGDIKNGNTELEATTPIISAKKKFDKRTELVIDEEKIQSIITDSSNSSKNSDDDLILIDLVNITNYQDSAILSDCIHRNENGYLTLFCYDTPFDTLPLTVGSSFIITSGLNVGNWIVLEIDKAKLILNKTVGIQQGTTETPVTYIVNNGVKNRTSEGFTIIENVANRNTATNLRHNPKFQMARWFPFYGSSLMKKKNTDLIIINDYKNNGDIKIKPDPIEISNELQGETIYKENEPLGRLRNYSTPFFDGRSVEITLVNVSFWEFFKLFNNWRYGIDNDYMTSRGYIKVNTPNGMLEVYPFGDKGIEHNKQYNELTIRGKVKNMISEYSITPILISADTVNHNTIDLVWSYDSAVDSSGIVQLQYSINGLTWETLETHTADITSATVTNNAFAVLPLGAITFFRVVYSDSAQLNTPSNIKQVVWSYNNMIYKEILFSENTPAGKSTLNFEIIGTGDVNIEFEFKTVNLNPASYKIINRENLAVIHEFSNASGIVDNYVINYPTFNSPLKLGIEISSHFKGISDLGYSTEVELTISNTNGYSLTKLLTCM